MARADGLLTLLSSAKPLKDRARVHFHSHTAETVATVVLHDRKQICAGERAFAQLRLADSILLLPGDHFVIRQFSPVVTIGGGVILDAAGPVRKAAGWVEFLRIMHEGAPETVLQARIARRGKLGFTIADAVAETGWTPERVKTTAKSVVAKNQIVAAGEFFLSGEAFRAACSEAVAAVAEFQRKNPLVGGVPREELREQLDLNAEVLAAVIERLGKEKQIEISGEFVHLSGRGVVMKDDEAESKGIIESAFASAGLKAPSLKEVLSGLKVDQARAQKIVTLLLRDKVLIKVSDELVFHRDALADLRKRLAIEKAKSVKIDVGRFKDLTGVTRKYAIPLLEYLDRERVTRRVGNERVIL